MYQCSETNKTRETFCDIYFEMSLKKILLGTVFLRNRYIGLSSVSTITDKKYRFDESEGFLFRTKGKILTAAVFSSVLIGAAVNEQIKDKNVKSQSNDVVIEAGEKLPDLPTYTAEEVSKHGDNNRNCSAPGNLHDDDVIDHSDDELWVKEPVRDNRLIVKTAKPFNAEIPAKYQIKFFDTPNELFYVRQHMPVPELDADDHRLKVTVKGSKIRTEEFSLRDLDKFRRVTTRAALMCAGNRRSEMNEQVKPVKGIGWMGGAISNAVWGGVYLRDVLLYSGVDPEDTKGKHVIFTGADIDATGVNFSTSIPLDMAMNPSSGILLATTMNGHPLPPDHGRPLRVVVPGAPAVRSVKWLQSITVSEDESPSHWHQKDYRAFNPSKTWETADFATAPPVYSLPVTSAICDPADGDVISVKNGAVQVRGYAYSGGGAKIVRVDVSADGGRSWWEARELQADAAPPQQHYGWTLWTASVPVATQQKEVELWAKATDSNFNTQPERFNDIWNIRGILSNAYHRIKIKLVH
uniref:Sulfite oxidase n=1 Tax=Bombyx mori TaxID=7091 RepID=A0A8R2LV21_BOMMO|nr:sulfite oxidase isoform X3 [Bombyx mori]